MKKLPLLLLVIGFFSPKPVFADDSLLSFVPENTKYFLGNSKSYPKEFMDFYIKAIGGMESLAKHIYNDKQQGSLEGFYNALLIEFYASINRGGIESIGLPKYDIRQVIYGLDLYPILRYTVVDIEKVKELVKKAENKANYKLDWQKCKGHDCFLLDYAGNKYKSAFILMPRQLAIAFFPKNSSDKYINHLVGESKPSKALSDGNILSNMIEENNYAGYGEGFVKLKQILVEVEQEVGKSLQGGKRKEFDNCMALAGKIVDNTPEMIFGTKGIKNKSFKAEMLLKTSSALATYLQSLSDNKSAVTRVKEPLIDLGINIDMRKLRDALMSLVDFIKTNGQQTGCVQNTQKLDEFNQNIGLGITLGLDKLRGLYLALTNMSFKDIENKPDFASFVSLYAHDMPGLLKVLTTMVKPLAGLDVKADGNKKQLPTGVLPSVFPDVSYSVHDEKLDLFVSSGIKIKPQKMLVDSNPGLLYFSLDSARYYKTLGEFLKKTGKGNKQDGETLALFGLLTQGTSTIMPSIKQVFRPDERGLAVEIESFWK